MFYILTDEVNFEEEIEIADSESYYHSSRNRIFREGGLGQKRVVDDVRTTGTTDHRKYRPEEVQDRGSTGQRKSSQTK